MKNIQPLKQNFQKTAGGSSNRPLNKPLNRPRRRRGCRHLRRHNCICRRPETVETLKRIGRLTDDFARAPSEEESRQLLNRFDDEIARTRNETIKNWLGILKNTLAAMLEREVETA